MLLAQAITVAADGDDMAVVEQSVKDRRSDDRIAEDGTPFADGAVARQQHVAALVAPQHQLEEQVRGIGAER